nr:DUF3368 domain-containing protein [Halorubrum sp. F4]
MDACRIPGTTGLRRTSSAAYVVLSAVKRGDLSSDEGRETIDSMIDAGWYVAPDVYTKVVRKLESFE